MAGSQSNGVGAYRRNRDRSVVTGFALVDYRADIGILRELPIEPVEPTEEERAIKIAGERELEEPPATGVPPQPELFPPSDDALPPEDVDQVAVEEEEQRFALAEEEAQVAGEAPVDEPDDEVDALLFGT